MTGRRWRAWPIAAIFAGVIALQVLVAAVSIDLLSSVRAYVTGESLYSKGQKDAQIHLLDYAYFQRERDYQSFLVALAVPLGDRLAREELQRSAPDLEAVRRGFLAGGNHPDDIDGLIRLFRLFHRVPFMADPIATWTEGDRVIQQMRTLVEDARERVLAGDQEAAAVSDLRVQAPMLNKRLTELERQFSDQLGAASRQVTWLLLGANLTLAALFALTGIAFVRQSLRERAAGEAGVRERQASLQRLLDSAAEGLYGVDTDGNCTFMNRSALAMLGYERESDVIGQDVHRLIHHTRSDGRPYPHSECKMYRAYRQRAQAHVADEVFWRRDGQSFPVEYWSYPVNERGQVQGIVVTFFDISERLRAQSALRDTETRLSRLVDTVADGVITVDANERIVLFNRAAERLFGHDASALVGAPVEQLMPARLRDRYRVRARQFLRGRTGTDNGGAAGEWIGVHAGGQEFPVEASLSRLDADKDVLLTVVLRDASLQRAAREERQARMALEASNRAKTQFLSRMSHELRTPLNAVLGFAQLLRIDRAQPLSADQLERVQHIEHAGTHLLALVNDVLDLSRVESGQMHLALEPVDVRSVAGEAMAIVMPLAASAGVTVHSDVPTRSRHRGDGANEFSVLADRVRLRQVLVNLLTNAVKYNRPGGQVSIGYLREVDDQDQLVIADSGVGMTSAQLSRLYEPFNRLGADRSRIEGTGIGLVLSRHLVELMHGRLRIESVFGRGTLATISLRHAVNASRPVAPATAAGELTPSSATDQALHVLYAEDNEVNVEVVRQMMRLRPSVSLQIARSGKAAAEMARRDPPDLLLMDMNLGDMTGLQLAESLRGDPHTAHVRLVALTADAMPEQVKAALDAGFDAYLTKPIAVRDLMRVLDQQPLHQPE